MKEQLISQIRALTKRIGQAKRTGVTELAERLRIARVHLAVQLARNYDQWMLVNPDGETEFVDQPTWKSRVAAWQDRKRRAASTPTVVAEPPEGQAPQESAPPQDSLQEFFGDPISVYTRAQALEDGILIDVTPWASGCFRHPVAITAALWAIVSDLPPGPGGASTLDDRIREVLRAAVQVAIESSRRTSQFTFQLLMGTSGGIRDLALLAHSGPGDQGEPVITIGFPSDF